MQKLKQKSGKRIFIFFLLVVFFFTSTANAAVPALEEISGYITAIANTMVSDFETTPPTVATINGDWSMMCLARSGRGNPSIYNQYYAAACQKMSDQQGILSDDKMTEYARLILGLTSIGKDVTNVAGYNLLNYLKDYEAVIAQGINGPIWALIALDCHDYEIPERRADDTITEENYNSRLRMIDYILSKQKENGGWHLNAYISQSDPDMTGMALQALYRYTKSDIGKGITEEKAEAVRQAIDRAKVCMANMQTEAGDYVCGGSPNVESTAQIMMALIALDIDPGTYVKHTELLPDIKGTETQQAEESEQMPALMQDQEKIEPEEEKTMEVLQSEEILTDAVSMDQPKTESEVGSVSALEALLKYYANDGNRAGFRHVMLAGRDAMATDQGMYTLVAYERWKQGESYFYDMRDVVIGEEPLTGIVLNANWGNFPAGNTSYTQLKATVIGGDKDDVTVSWTSDDPCAASVDENGMVTIYPGASKTKKQAVITATAKDSKDNLYEAMYEVYRTESPIMIIDKDPVDVDSSSNVPRAGTTAKTTANRLKNPASSILPESSSGLTFGKSDIQMVDITGRGKLRSTTTVITDMLYRIGEIAKQNAMPFIFGICFAGIIWLIACAVSDSKKHQRRKRVRNNITRRREKREEHIKKGENNDEVQK